MINAYDFDKTIYDGDSTIDFYFFCLKKKKSIIFYLPIQFFALFLYIVKIKNKEYFKENFFVFLKKFDNIDEIINEFWKININKIKPWYLKQKQNSDLIISASPEFLLKPLEEKLKVKVIATIVDKKTGKLLSKNCYGEEKVSRYKSEVHDKLLSSFYTDSMSDLPMLKLAKKKYLVKKNIIREINVE